MVQNEGRVLRWTVVHKSARAMQITATLTIAIVLMSFVKRVVIDVPHLAAGTVPGGDFDRRYVTRPWLAYLHITPGVLYLLLAILQLSYRFRSRHYVTHRQLGRVAAGAAMLSGVFALIFGGLFSFGGPLEASASVVFSVWLLVTLVLAVRAIRRGDVNRHRRGMIRAFAVGTGVGTVRIWLGFFDGLGLLNFRSALGPAFWIGFSLHALAAELWLRAFPDPPEVTEGSPGSWASGGGLTSSPPPAEFSHAVRTQPPSSRSTSP